MAIEGERVGGLMKSSGSLEGKWKCTSGAVDTFFWRGVRLRREQLPHSRHLGEPPEVSSCLAMSEAPISDHVPGTSQLYRKLFWPIEMHGENSCVAQGMPKTARDIYELRLPGYQRIQALVSLMIIVSTCLPCLRNPSMAALSRKE